MVTTSRATAYEHVWYQQSSSYDTWQHATLAELNRRPRPPQFVTIQRWATSERNLDAPHLADFYLEADAKSPAEFAAMLAGFRRLVAYFVEDLGTPPEWIGLSYSGSRSIHLRINHRVIGAEPSPHLTRAHELWATDLARRFSLKLDLEIYTRARMWRQVGTLHPKGKRYKIPLLWQELNLSIDEIRKLAERPRPDPLPADDEPELVPAARDEFRVYLAEALKGRRRTTHQAADPTIRIGEGGRNTYLFRRGGVLRRYAFSEAAIFAAIMVENEERCDPPLPEHEVRKIAESIAGYPPHEVPEDPEEAEDSARKDADRLRRVITARHDFTASAPLTATQKNVALTIGRILPTLPTNDRGEVKLCASYVAKIAGCSRGTVSTLYHTVAKARIWSIRHADEYQDNRIQQVTYVRLSEDLDRSEDAFLDAITRADIEQKPRGGARTKTIALRPVAVEDLACVTCGDAGAVTKATTYCGVCGEAAHEHRPLIHPAGWLSDDDDGDDPDDSLMFKFEHQNGWRTDANNADRDDPVGDPDAQKLTDRDADSLVFNFEHQEDDDGLDLFGPVAVEDDDLEEAPDDNLLVFGRDLADLELDPGQPKPTPAPLPDVCGLNGCQRPPGRMGLCEIHVKPRSEWPEEGVQR